MLMEGETGCGEQAISKNSIFCLILLKMLFKKKSIYFKTILHEPENKIILLFTNRKKKK